MLCGWGDWYPIFPEVSNYWEPLREGGTFQTAKSPVDASMSYWIMNQKSSRTFLPLVECVAVALYTRWAQAKPSKKVQFPVMHWWMWASLKWLPSSEWIPWCDLWRTENMSMIRSLIRDAAAMQQWHLCHCSWHCLGKCETMKPGNRHSSGAFQPLEVRKNE